ncbi:Oidioi.mRNA.OKI2018_I69.chr2.g6082.t1.cds [Oikopleura dioica]|uniref:Synaptosomal-associated protein 29 n=1 Tax=Oikopleura dioica TaxID=34765 RepID=A0ABN7T5J4_OIKDI|nr:Oidioi.mRNA.OKI2018_I69.chr2.g6082.t1.cds [Oikopleura dioica]
MSNWDDAEFNAEFDPNKDYSVQVQKNDGGLSSTQRALQKIAESEEIGAQTASELYRQREVLERTKGRLEESESHLRESEGHLKSIKSFWGQTMQNWFGKKPKGDASSSPSKKSSSPAKATAASSVSSSNPSSLGQSSGMSSSSSADHMSRLANKKAPSTREQQIEQNLTDMSSGLSRLKNLGLTLQTEIDAQDELIDDVDLAIQRNNLKTQSMNKQMNKMLKK